MQWVGEMREEAKERVAKEGDHPAEACEQIGEHNYVEEKEIVETPIFVDLHGRTWYWRGAT